MTDLRQIAYNAGLEVRYAVAASGLDPIQHIPEVDAIIERRLAECRREALEEAAAYHDDMASQHEASRDESDHHAMMLRLHRRFAAAIRALSDSIPTPLQEQNANGNAAVDGACENRGEQ